MFLKRLDVAGFKSFAERISMEFVPGVTVVVGPNGSGKSNVTDAIRWVLGEQSAKSLRGSKMEDIIFAGSDSRKPLNFAEVTLTLDNETNSLPIDFHEVSVTRRVYRSGDSEFLINNQPCRLKDIIDLFMDSGLGREAFSIISQGKVEEILSSKAEDRRVIFEEAAGVLKYKNRKKKAETKLFETQENLNRVNDILYELEGQVEPLRIQASMAKDYLEKKEELEESEVALTVYEIETLHQSWESLSHSFAEHSAREEKLAAAAAVKEAEAETIRTGLKGLDQSLQDLQEKLLHSSEELEKLEGKKEVLKERKKNASQNKYQLEQALTQGERRIMELSSSKIKEQAVLAELEKTAGALQEALHDKQKKIGLYSGSLDEKIETLKSDYIEILNKQASAKHETNYLDQQLSQQLDKGGRLDTENAKFLAEREEITKKKSAVLSNIEEMQKKLDEHVSLFREQKHLLEKTKAAYDKQETVLYQAYQFLQQSKSKKEMLEEMEEDYSGFFQGVKEILKARNGKLKGVEGAVAELITVPKDFQLAVETALGGAMQNIVMENEQAAREAIAYLKRNAYGRATFLPLTVIQARQIPSAQLSVLTNHPAFVGTAAELIEYDPKYARIAENLLGTVVIAKDLKGANELAKMVYHKYRFVTLEGDVVNPGGSMTGGAAKQKTTSLLSRKSELEDLKNKLSGMEAKTAQLEQHVKKLKEDTAALEKRVEEIRLSGEALRLEEQALKSSLREIELQEKNVNERLHLYDLDKKAIEEEQTNKSLRLSELKDILSECAVQLAELDENIKVMTDQKKQQQTSKESLADEIGGLRVEIAAKKEQLQNQREKYSRIEEELALETVRVREIKDDLSLLSSEMNSSSSGEETLAAAAAQKLEDKQAAAAQIVSQKEEQAALTEQLESLVTELKELQRLHKGMAESVRDEEVKLNRLDVELENRLAHLREEYMLTYEAAKEKHPLRLSPEETKRKVKLIRLAIEELGSVNLGAIEEYDRVAERYRFLSEQKSDLQQAKDTLFEVIEEMDAEMKRRFSETFYAIKEQFTLVFPSLFGGGRAELKLTDPEDLLRTGVEIIAQPPGKKLQNLGLLSGGERALTAIALLFSILKVRPVPFCILDEVEAALDEANVFRFSQYLKRFSEETQFIVITHRKGTMEEADVLYGITMQESGVSKLVSVRLGEMEEYAKA